MAVAVSAFLLAATVATDIVSANQLSLSDYLIFKVQMNQDLGYSMYNNTPISQTSFLMNIQYLGVAIMFSSLLWISRAKITNAFKPMKRWIEQKTRRKRRAKSNV